MKRTLFSALSLVVTPVLLLSSTLLSAIVQPAPPPTLELVGQIGGTANGVAVQGKYLYVASGESGLLRIVNVADPAHPVEVGSFAASAPVDAVTIAGDLAYVAATFAGLRIVSISDPAHPVEVGFFRTPAGHARGVAISGNLAYVAQEFDGLRIVSISDPAHPVELGSVDFLKDALDVAVVGSTVYVTDVRGGLYIFDVADPAHPAQLGRYAPPAFTSAVAVAGNVAYVAAISAGLRVVSIADPAHPVEVGSFATPGAAFSVEVAGNLAYVGDAASLRVLNVADPAHPAEVASFATPGTVMGIALAGDLIYVAAPNGGVIILHLHASGPPPSGAFTLAAGGGLPAVASLPGSGRFLAVWDTGAGLSAQFVDSSGLAVGPEFVPTAPDSRIGIPSVTANPAAGEFLVTWWHFRKPTGGIFGQRLTADGALIGDKFMISDANTLENWAPAVAYNPRTNQYLVAWYQDRGEPGGSHIYGQRVAADGSLIGDIFAINREGLQARPAMVANETTGEYLAVWSRLDLGLGGALFGQRLTANGEPFGGTLPIAPGDKPGLTYNPVSGDALVAWANGTAQAARVRPDGSVVGGILLSEPGGGQNFNRAAHDAAGNYMTVWEGPAGENQSTVFGRELTPAGELRSVQVTLDDRPSSGQLLYPAIAYNAGANVYLIAWESRVEDQRLVRARIYHPGEAPPVPPPALLVNGDFEGGFYLLQGQSIANGWAPFTLAGNPSFAGERFAVHNGRWAYKISGYAPFTAGLAQVMTVQPGKTYQVMTFYQLYPPGDGQAFLGVQDGSLPQRLVGDSWPGVWRPLSQTITPTTDRLLVTLLGNHGAAPNTNVYFDDVTVTAVGAP
jgi:hypothetical protein